MREISFLIELIASTWSGVSIYGKSLLKSSNDSSSILRTDEVDACLLDSISKISAAWSYALLAALFLLFSHLFEDNES